MKMLGHLELDQLCPTLAAIGDKKAIAPLRSHQKKLSSARDKRLIDETIEAITAKAKIG